MLLWDHIYIYMYVYHREAEPLLQVRGKSFLSTLKSLDHRFEVLSLVLHIYVCMLSWIITRLIER